MATWGNTFVGMGQDDFRNKAYNDSLARSEAAKEAAIRQAERMGINPNSGAFMNMMNQAQYEATAGANAAANAGKPKLLYDWQEIDINFIFGTLMLSSFALSFVWSILIHRFWRKEERSVRWTASCLFFAFPFIVCLILTNFPIHLAFLPKTKLKEKNHRIYCMGQLKQIYIDLSQYANDNNGYYPDDLEKFVESCGLYNFSCCPAAVWKRLVEEGRKRDLEHGRGEPFLSDYNYYGKGRKSTDAPFVILEDKIDNHRGNYKNFLRSDGWIGSAKKIE